MKVRWLFLSLVLGILAIAVTGGAVLAHRDGVDGQAPSNNFASRVASILGLEDAQVKDAFHQARKEIQAEALQWKLDRQVEQGHITQEEADEYLEWYQSRPEALSPGFGFRRFGGHGFFGPRIRGGPRWHGPRIHQEFLPLPSPDGTGGTSV